MNRGIGGLSRGWETLDGRCQHCTNKVTHTRGIICVNFGLVRPGWATCQRTWCGRCYSMTPGRPFLVSPADGNVLPISPEAQEFSTERNGDHLLCLFECEFCMFERVGGRSANATGVALQLGSTYERRTKADQGRAETDQRILECFWRANLDAFWSRGSETVCCLLGICYTANAPVSRCSSCPAPRNGVILANGVPWLCCWIVWSQDG
jgi:hypothetical protein